MTDHRTSTNYRSLSSVASALLPRAEKMHREGMTWRQIAQDLKISYSALFIWRRLEQDRATHDQTGDIAEPGQTLNQVAEQNLSYRQKEN